jgi:DNA-binding NarL/FixJ family response regulator
LLVRGAMQLALAAKRVSSLPPHLLDVVACVSEGMSNRQVAERLGYKNARTVGTLVYEINKKLGLERISSRTEKRRLLIDAFRTARTKSVVRIKMSPVLALDANTADRLRSFLRRGYEIEALEVILRKPR